MELTLTPENVSYLVGVVLSLAFSYIPKLESAYNGLEPMYKRLVMLILLVAAAGAIYGLSCAGFIGQTLTCDKEGLMTFGKLLYDLAVANQVTFLLTKSSK